MNDPLPSPPPRTPYTPKTPHDGNFVPTTFMSVGIMGSLVAETTPPLLPVNDFESKGLKPKQLVFGDFTQGDSSSLVDNTTVVKKARRNNKKKQLSCFICHDKGLVASACTNKEIGKAMRLSKKQSSPAEIDVSPMTVDSEIASSSKPLEERSNNSDTVLRDIVETGLGKMVIAESSVDKTPENATTNVELAKSSTSKVPEIAKDTSAQPKEV